jgi:hypothetical protein
MTIEEDTSLDRRAQEVVKQYSDEYRAKKLAKIVTLNGAYPDKDSPSVGRAYDIVYKLNRGDDWENRDKIHYPAICMKFKCDNVTLDREFQGEGLCERCGQHTVMSSVILTGEISEERRTALMWRFDVLRVWPCSECGSELGETVFETITRGIKFQLCSEKCRSVHKARHALAAARGSYLIKLPSE